MRMAVMDIPLVTVAKSHSESGGTVIAEHLIASFILQMHASGSEIKSAMAAGAALALQCYEEPFATAALAQSGADMVSVSQAGIEVADDILTAYAASMRVGTLIQGLDESEVDDMVTEVYEKPGGWETRADMVRGLEEMLLEKMAAMEMGD